MSSPNPLIDPMLVSILCELAAVQARVAGMVAENQTRLADGHALAYGEAEFNYEANHCGHLAEAARSRG